MASPRVIRVAEFSPIPRASGVGDDLRGRLLAATSHLPFEVFRVSRAGLSTAGVVGMVDLGQVQIEITPKAGLVGPDHDGTASSAFLLDLLAYAGLSARTRSLHGKVAKTPRPLLEVLARSFAELLHERLWDGPPRRYSERSERSPVLRGRLEMAEFAKHPLQVDGHLPIRYAPLHHDHRLSQVIAATALLVSQVTNSSRTWAMLEHCLSHLDGVDVPALTPELVDGVQLARSELHWQEVLDLARLLATGQRPAPTTGGRNRALSLLFPLHDLFEGVLRRALPGALEPYGLRLSPRKAGGFLLRSLESSREAIGLRPDFLFAKAQLADPALVGDAKWKVLDNRPGFGVQEGDAYQIATYMMRHRLDLGLLFYPFTTWMADGGAASWTHRFAVTGRDGAQVVLVGVDVASLVSRDKGRRQRAQRALGASIIDVFDEAASG